MQESDIPSSFFFQGFAKGRFLGLEEFIYGQTPVGIGQREFYRLFLCGQRMFDDGVDIHVGIVFPIGGYSQLNFNSTTGNAVVPDGYSFDSVNMSLTTGNVKFSSSVDALLSITTTTGITYIGTRHGECVVHR